MTYDVIVNKTSVIERCLKRVCEVYDQNPNHLKDYTKQDSIILNIQRACEAAIDLAMHIVAEKKLGIPQSSRHCFELLMEHKMITEDIANKMKAMVGFRNIAVHDYQKVNEVILKKIIEEHLDDFRKYTKQLIKNEGC